MRRILFCILAAISGNLIMTGAPAENEAAKTGQKWLSLVDDEKYVESWNQASSMFRHEVTQEQWVAALKRSREPLDSLVSRTASRVEFSKFLRGAPEGDYAIIHFTTAFTGKSTTERLTLVKEDGGGKWPRTAFIDSRPTSRFSSHAPLSGMTCVVEFGSEGRHVARPFDLVCHFPRCHSDLLTEPGF